jgi:hypothetical protein
VAGLDKPPFINAGIVKLLCEVLKELLRSTLLPQRGQK